MQTIMFQVSDACTGVKRKGESDNADEALTDEAIAKLLKDNKTKIKRPVVGFDPHKKAANVKKVGGTNINAGSNIHVEL